MGVIERKEREKLELKELILQGARLVFLKEGYEKTSIRKIAEEIEYSPATIYLHFQDKNDLLLALHKEAFLHLMKTFQGIEIEKTAWDKLTKMGALYIEYALNNPEEYELMFILTAPMDALSCKEEMWQDGLNAIGMVEGILLMCVEEGYFRKNLDTQTAAILLWAQMHGLVSLYLRNRLDMCGENKKKEIVDKCYDMFLGMVKAHF